MEDTMLRKCPRCKRRLLKAHSALTLRTYLRAHCQYCGSEFVVRKGFLSFISTAVVWGMGIFLFFLIGTLEFEVWIKTVISALFIMSCLLITPHIGRLKR